MASWGHGSLVQCLPGVTEALSSIPSTAKTKENQSGEVLGCYGAEALTCVLGL
jgi:hypothetical protein